MFFGFIILQPLKVGKPSWTKVGCTVFAEIANTYFRHAPLSK